jgi:predicted ATPase
MRDLPTGTVTLLFTDIEGSTRLLEQLGAEYEHVLAEHHRLIREAVAAHDGVEVDTQGDSFLCAFARASDALGAAADAQRALATTRVRVRMGLHTGEPTRTEEGYVGIDVHRAARVMAAGHGGQVLLSQTTRDLLGDELPLRDLGEHRLKDLASAIRLHQLGYKEYPPLKTLESRPTNLPLQPTRLVGREREVEEVASLLRRDDVRLLTLTGPGGTGKTRVALQAAAELLEAFADGVWLVNLAALADPALVPGAIAQSLALPEQPGEPISHTLASHLREREVLLLLDNFEQVADAASVLSELVAAAPALKVLVTSRAALHLSAELEFPVPPLDDAEAIELFADRARAVKPSFALNGNRDLLVAICRRLDNLPLAVELAAARIKLLPERALLDRLQGRLKLLTGGPRDADERQRTLRATIDWSYGLLSPEEQVLFARLSVFAGGRTLEAIETVCSPLGEVDVFDGVASLLDKSLLRQEEDAADEPRFVMLETIHEYARDRLAELGEADELRRRHAEYFASLAEAAEAALRHPDQGAWLARLDAEQDNLRAALDASRDVGDAELLARITISMARFWEIRGLLAEARAWLEDVLRVNHAPDTRARALLAAAMCAGRQGDWQTQETSAREAAVLLRKLGDKQRLGHALKEVGIAISEQARSDEAAALFEEAAELAREVGDRLSESACTNNLGALLQEQGQYELATTMFERCLELDRELDDSYGTTFAMLNLCLATLGAGNHEIALAYGREGLKLSLQLGYKLGVAFAFDVLGKTAAARGEFHRAARLFTSSRKVLNELGAELPASDKRETEETLRRVQAALGEKHFERACAEADALGPDDAVADALEATAAVTRHPA